MPSKDIKNLLDEIIDNSENDYKQTIDIQKDNVFDKDTFREKLSMYVLKDMIKAMLHDDVNESNEGMVTERLHNHIYGDCKGSGYGYLCDAKNNLKSPTIASVIQEIDDMTESAAIESAETKENTDEALAKIDTKEILKDVDNYEELRSKLKKEVSEKVVADISKALTQSSDAPTFDKLDEKIKKKEDVSTDETPTEEPATEEPATEEPATEESAVASEEAPSVESTEGDVTTESVILRMAGNIITESNINNGVGSLTVEDGTQIAIVEYCLSELDFLMNRKQALASFTKYL